MQHDSQRGREGLSSLVALRLWLRPVLSFPERIRRTVLLATHTHTHTKYMMLMIIISSPHSHRPLDLVPSSLACSLIFAAHSFCVRHLSSTSLYVDLMTYFSRCLSPTLRRFFLASPTFRPLMAGRAGCGACLPVVALGGSSREPTGSSSGTGVPMTMARQLGSVRRGQGKTADGEGIDSRAQDGMKGGQRGLGAAGGGAVLEWCGEG